MLWSYSENFIFQVLLYDHNEIPSTTMQAIDAPPGFLSVIGLTHHEVCGTYFACQFSVHSNNTIEVDCPLVY